MKKHSLFARISRRLPLILAAASALLVPACTTENPTLIPLPTASVPSLIEINSATELWTSGNNQNYFINVEETDENGSFLYRIVIVDGEIQAAQRLEKIDGEWQSPAAIDLETAQNYTVDALLARIQHDATGQGGAPMDMLVVFDDLSGFPTLVEAKGIPSYTEDGKIRLNRDYGYTLSVTVGVLLEESFGLGKTPLLTLSLSGGEQVACSILRIYPDGSSIYSDNCRQVLLQIRPPADLFEQLAGIAAGLAPVEDEHIGENEINRLSLAGSGSGTADSEDLDALWALALRLNELLSSPIGAGVTLLAQQDDSLVGIDMRTGSAQPASLDLLPPFYGAATDPAGVLLVYADSEGLKWLDAGTGDGGSYFSNPPGQHFVPVVVANGGRVVLQRFSGDDPNPTWGWTSLEDHSFNELPGSACITTVVQEPGGVRMAIAARSGAGCEGDAGLWIWMDQSSEVSRAVEHAEGITAVAWAPGGGQLAVVLGGGVESGGGLFLVKPDGSGLAPVPLAAEGTITGIAWGHSGELLYYGLSGSTDADGIYAADPATGETADSIPGDDLIPLQFDPSGEFLAFLAGGELRSWSINFGQVIPASEGSRFAGWLDSSGR